MVLSIPMIVVHSLFTLSRFLMIPTRFGLFLAHVLLFLNGTSANPFQSYPLVNSRLVHAARDENFIDTPGTPQNLCGESNFVVLKDNGPATDDCALLHRTVESNLHGFWMVGNMGSDGSQWVEFTRLRTCGLKVRRTDGQKGDVPIGDVDVSDLVSSVLAGFPGRDKLPATKGEITCCKKGVSAAMEWMICAV